jgi:RecB family exonuclease
VSEVKEKLPTAHSHSSLTQYGTCPYQYYRERIVKDIPYEQGEAAAWGEYVHTALENFVKDGTPLPSNVANLQEIADKVAALTGETTVEAVICVNEHWLEVPWTSKQAWFRAKIDVQILRRPKREILVVDYKTGSSRYGTKGQEQRYAACLFMLHPWADTVKLRWMYLKEGPAATVRHDYTRDQLDTLVAHIHDPIQQIKHSYDVAHWPKKPSGLCNGWCGVKDCDFWKPKREKR